MKSSASEQLGTPVSIWNINCRAFSPGQTGRPWVSEDEAVLYAWPGRKFGLCNDFDSDAELFIYRTYKYINYNNVFCKQFDQNEHFSSFEFSSAGIKIGV